MGRMRPAFATSEAMEVDQFLDFDQLLDLHPRVVGVGDRRAQRAVGGVGERSERREGIAERSAAPAGWCILDS